MQDFLTKPKRSLKKNSTQKLIVTYGGSFGLANALDPLMQLLLNQKELYDKIHFNLIGSGYLKEHYAQRLMDFNNITLMEKIKRSEFMKYLLISDLAFISWNNVPELYKYGVSAQKYYDYMAAGIPILSVQNAINDPVRQCGCGIIVKNKPEAIRNGLHQFIAMDELERKKMGQKGKDFVKKFTYEKLSKKYIKVFNVLDFKSTPLS